MSLITALNPGLTGVLSQQKQVEITGNNIANVNTPGYSRQTATLSPKAAINIQGLLMGQGVDVEDVSREYDKFVTGQIEDQNSVLGRESAKNGPLEELERIFNIGEDSLASDIEGFFSAWHDLSQNPAGSVEREQVMYKGKNLLESFDQTKSDMVVVRQNINDTLNAEVNGINRKLRELAQLNADIKQKESLGHVASVDQDERDLLVKELSKTMGIQTFDAGESQIGAQLPGGIPLVEGDTAMEFQSYHEDGELKFRIKSGDIKLPVDKDNFGGQFKGLLDIRDEFIPDLENRVNTLEYNIVSQVNAQHEDGFGLDGGTGRAFFSKQASYRSQTGFGDPDDLAFNTGSLDIVLNVGTSAESRTEIAIGQGENSLNGIRDAINNADAGVLASVVPDSSGEYHLDLTPEKQGDAVTILSDNEAYGFDNLQETAGAEELEVAVRDTGAVAAAGRAGGAPGDNENALAIHSLAEAKVAEDNKTFVDSYGRIASVVGTETNRNKVATNGAEDSMTQLENLRESTVGVSIEEEMINLTMFQKGFEASSRYVQTIDEMLGTIIGLKR
ncbi:MAG: flagellar hook-associated protein FlgK [Desulfosalsimonadaceae bacterium]